MTNYQKELLTDRELCSRFDRKVDSNTERQQKHGCKHYVIHSAELVLQVVHLVLSWCFELDYLMRIIIFYYTVFVNFDIIFQLFQLLTIELFN